MFSLSRQSIYRQFTTASFCGLNCILESVNSVHYLNVAYRLELELIQVCSEWTGLLKISPEKKYIFIACSSTLEIDFNVLFSMLEVRSAKLFIQCLQSVS